MQCSFQSLRLHPSVYRTGGGGALPGHCRYRHHCRHDTLISGMGGPLQCLAAVSPDAARFDAAGFPRQICESGLLPFCSSLPSGSQLAQTVAGKSVKSMLQASAPRRCQQHFWVVFGRGIVALTQSSMQLAVIADMTAKSTDVGVCSACFWASSHCVQVQVQAPSQAAHEERHGHVAQDLSLPQLSFLGAPMGLWLHACSRAFEQRSPR